MSERLQPETKASLTALASESEIVAATPRKNVSGPLGQLAKRLLPQIDQSINWRDWVQRRREIWAFDGVSTKC
jgi:hypothetical protein